MAINLIILISLSLIFFYNFFNKNLIQIQMLLIFIISTSIKMMFISFEFSGMFINQFTINDEITFLGHKNVKNLSPGDNFLISILYFFRNINDSEIFIKYLPIFFSFIFFYYLVKIFNNLKYKNVLKVLILIFCLTSPAYIMFNYSVTKEFLQGAFLAPSIYYSLKIIDKITITRIIKLLSFLILFSYTHRGFEVVSVLILLNSLSFSILNYYDNFFKKIWFTLFLAFLIISIFLLILLINSSIGQNLLGDEFRVYLNNIREAEHGAGNTYRISIDNSNFIKLGESFLLTIYYYFFYIQGLTTIKHFYFFVDSILSAVILIAVFYTILLNNFFDRNNKYKYLFITIIFLIMSFGFAIFTYNTGNAMRHKSVTNFMLYLLFPLLINFVTLLVKRPYNIFNQNNNKTT